LNEVQTAIDDLAADFAGHWYLPTAVYKVAVQYHLQAYRLENEGRSRDSFGKAAEIFERVIDEYPGCDVMPRAYRSAGDCYRKLGDYEKSIQFYQKVVDDYPRFRTAWNALFLVGRNYEDLKRVGSLAKSEADLKTKAAYERLLEEYPTCPGANHARRWLSRYNSK
jgi:TolA-binding protein